MKIELKKPSISDKSTLAKMCHGVDRRYLSERLPYPYTEEDAEWWINMAEENDGKTGIWRVIYADGALVGNTSVELKSDVCRKDGEIGYILATEYWSKGIMTEAVRQMCELAFDKLDIIRITGLVYAPNVASQRVLEKNGFLREGLLRSAVYKNGQIYDLCLYGKVLEGAS